MNCPTPISVKSEYSDDTNRCMNETRTSMTSSPTLAVKLKEQDVILSLPHHYSLRHTCPLDKKMVALNRDLASTLKVGSSERLRVAQTIVATIYAMGGRFLDYHEIEEFRPPIFNISLADLAWIVVSESRAVEMTNTSLEHSEVVENASLENTQCTPSSGASPDTDMKKSVDPSMLINLAPNQTVNLHFPVRAKVLYNVNCISEQFNEASIGVVASVSMDLSTRDLLYMIKDLGCDQEHESNHYFAEEELSFAPHSNVTLEVIDGTEKQKLNGKVSSVKLRHLTGRKHTLY